MLRRIRTWLWNHRRRRHIRRLAARFVRDYGASAARVAMSEAAAEGFPPERATFYRLVAAEIERHAQV